MELQALHTALATTLIVAWFAILLGWLATCGLDERSGERPEPRRAFFTDDRQTVMTPTLRTRHQPLQELRKAITMARRTVRPKVWGMRARQDSTTLTR
jgi:hypothetical protein